jgi:hypothetical protein
MPATTHGAPGSGAFPRRQRTAANEPVTGLARVATGVEPASPRTLVIIPAWNEDEALPATLAELARVRPQSEAALGQISGVGTRKLERYGAALLELLRD